MRRLAGRAKYAITSLAGDAVSAALLLALVGGALAWLGGEGARRIDDVETGALRQTLAAAPAADRSISATATVGDVASVLTGNPPKPLSAADLALVQTSLDRQLSSLGVPIVASSKSSDDWFGLAAQPGVAIAADSQVPGTTPILSTLRYRDTIAPETHLTAGRLPTASTAPSAGAPATFEVAVSGTAATQMHATVGQRYSVSLAPYGTVGVTVVGIFSPADPASSYWTTDADAATPYLAADGPMRGVDYLNVSMFVAPSAVRNLQLAYAAASAELETVTSLDVSRVTAAQAGALVSALTQADARLSYLDVTPPGANRAQTVTLTASQGPISELEDFNTQRGQMSSILSLLTTSLEILGVVILLLCVRLVAERRRAELALFRARGASGRALTFAGGRGGALAIPCILLGSVLSGADSRWPAAVLCAVSLFGPALLAPGKRGAGPRPARRIGAGSQAAVRRARRIALNAAVILVCAGSLLALRNESSQEGSQTGGNLLASAAPLLVAAPIALLLVHVAPPLIRTLAAVAAPGRGAVAFIGLARAARSTAGALLPGAALILAFAVISLGSTIHTEVSTAEIDASWLQTGADDVIEPAGVGASMPHSTVEAVAALPGVTRHVALYSTEIQGDAAYGLPFSVLVVDTAAYQAFTAGTPTPSLPATSGAGASVPVVVSPKLAASMGSKTYQLQFSGMTIPIRQGASTAATAALPDDDTFMIVPASALPTNLAETRPNLLLLDGPIASAALDHAAQGLLPGATITHRADALAALTGAPFQSGVFGLFDLAVWAALAGCVAALLINLTLEGPSREASLARLATMGLSRRRGELMVLTEGMPLILACLLGGVGASAAIAELVGPSLNLGVFAGGLAVATPRALDPWPLTRAALAVAGTAVLAMSAHTALAHRRGSTASLRLGDR